MCDYIIPHAGSSTASSGRGYLVVEDAGMARGYVVTVAIVRETDVHG